MPPARQMTRCGQSDLRRRVAQPRSEPRLRTPASPPRPCRKGLAGWPASLLAGGSCNTEVDPNQSRDRGTLWVRSVCRSPDSNAPSRSRLCLNFSYARILSIGRSIRTPPYWGCDAPEEIPVAWRVFTYKVCRSFRTPGSPLANSDAILSRALKRSSSADLPLECGV